MATTIYVTVVGKGTLAEVERYLGFGAEIDVSAVGSTEYRVPTFALLRVTDDDAHRARSNAEWNAHRLASGLWGARVFDTRAEALTALREQDCYV